MRLRWLCNSHWPGPRAMVHLGVDVPLEFVRHVYESTWSGVAYTGCHELDCDRGIPRSKMIYACYLCYTNEHNKQDIFRAPLSPTFSNKVALSL